MLNKNISLKIVGYKDWTEMSKKCIQCPKKTFERPFETLGELFLTKLKKQNKTEKAWLLPKKL